MSRLMFKLFSDSVPQVLSHSLLEAISYLCGGKVVFNSFLLSI